MLISSTKIRYNNLLLLGEQLLPAFPIRVSVAEPQALPSVFARLMPLLLYPTAQLVLLVTMRSATFRILAALA